MKRYTVFILSLMTALGIMNESGAQKFYIGSVEKSDEAVIQLVELTSNGDELKKIQELRAGPSPGYLSVSSDNKVLYTVTGDNRVHSIALEPDGKMLPLNSVGSKGVNPCHVSVDTRTRMAYVSNYSDGTFSVFSLNKDGSLEKLIYIEQFSGNSIHEKRQQSPHAHSAVYSTSGKYVYVADLGTDRVLNYEVNMTKGKIEPNLNQPYIETPPGAGPRHMVVHPSGKWLFVLNELDATISVFEILKNGVLTLKTSYPTLPADVNPEGNTSAAIRLHPNGKFLYISNRGFNAVHGFEINKVGDLQSIGYVKEGISIPRDFNISPDGNKMIVANLTTNDISVYLVEQTSGKLTYKRNLSVGVEPSCIEFIK